MRKYLNRLIFIFSICFLIHERAHAQWSIPIDLSLSNSEEPQVAVAPFGEAVAVWYRLNGNPYVVEAASKMDGGSWTTSIELSLPGENALSPQVVIDSSNNATAIWYELSGGNYDVYVSTKPFGGSWTSPVIISTLGLQNSLPQLTVDSFGNVTAIWRSFNGIDYTVQSSSKPFNGMWTTPLDISPSSSSIRDLQIASDPNGNATAVWLIFNGINEIVQSSSKLFASSWSAVIDLSPSGVDADRPQVAVDSFGNSIAVWERSDVIDTIQASSKTLNGSWTAPVELSQPGQDANAPQIAIDPAGNATAVWSESNGTNFLIKASSKSLGGNWTNSVNVSQLGIDAFEPQIAIDPAGNATVVWVGSDGTILLIKASSKSFNGTWSTPVDVSQSGQDNLPQIAVDIFGKATVVWLGNNRIVQSSTSSRVNFLTVSSLTPNVGLITGGETVIIKGTSFISGTTVTFDGIPVVVTIVDFQTLEVITPPHAEGYVNVVVENVLGQTVLPNAYLYENAVIPSPILSFVSPSQALAGTLLTLVGSNFQPGIQVLFGSAIAENVVFLDSSTLQVIAPPNSLGPVSITLINPDGGESTTPNAFVYAAPSPLAPVVQQVMPNSGPSTGGNQVTILGQNFTGTVVLFGTTPATFTRIDDSTIIAIAPPGTGIVDISVITEYGIGTLPLAYTYLSSPIPPTIPSSPRRGSIRKADNQFATQADLINVIRWHAPQNDSSIVAYQIFRNASLTHSIATLSANNNLQFEDHNRKKGRSYTYYIVSVDDQGRKSEPLILRSRSF